MLPIEFKIIDDHYELLFRAHMHTSMKKIIDSYKERQGITQNITLIYGSYEITIFDTPRLYTFGLGYYGQLGYCDHNLNVPKPIPIFLNVSAVSCGYSHTAVIAGGQLYMFGSNSSGELGNGYNRNLCVPSLIVNFENVMGISCGNCFTVVTANNQLYTFGNSNNCELGYEIDRHTRVPTIIETLQNVIAISCGKSHTAIIAY